MVSPAGILSSVISRLLPVVRVVFWGVEAGTDQGVRMVELLHMADALPVAGIVRDVHRAVLLHMVDALPVARVDIVPDVRKVGVLHMVVVHIADILPASIGADVHRA